MDSQPPDRPASESQPDDIAPLQGGELRVVGLGASAGGLKALRQFFAHMPPKSDMAFVVILHLSPEYESNLASLLQFSTAMPVTQVTEVTPVEPNHVYVIPPAKHLSIADGCLQLSEPQQTSGQRVSIDLFFRTLAETHGHNAAVVVLSGAGSDGTIGLKRVKERGGVTMAQDPQDAEYDSMPRNAIATGLVDFVLPADQLPRQILTYWRNAETIRLPPDDQARDRSDVDALHEIFTLLRVRTGHDFTNYKRSTMLRRIGRRMQVTGVSDIPAYLAALHERPGEVEALLRDLLISVTNFFRDHEAFGALEAIIPKLFVGKTTGDQLRVWVAGCATGEEAYSVAILLREYADQLDNPPEIQIFATDIDEDAISAARQGRYLEVIEADVSTERLRRFFSKTPGGYWVKKEVRDLVLFAVHNLLRDPPFSKLDLITCRNLLIYLDRELQQQILQLFHFVLRPDGLLMLGASEFADSASDLFSPIDKAHRLFARRAIARTVPLAPSMPLTGSIHRRGAGEGMVSAPKTLSFGELHQRLLEQYAPPSVIVDESYEILHLSDRAGRFLQFAGGEPSYNLLKVVHPDLRIELRTALFRATHSDDGSEARGVPMQIGGATWLVNLIVRPVQDPGSARGFVLVLFDEVGEVAEAGFASEDAAAIEPIARQPDEELQRTKDQLGMMIEQYETSVEELKASNEELQTINEELYSTTEELETSKEELQSVNEELITVNNELKAKVDELSRVNSDLQNFLAATDIGTIFLDRSLRIVRYTPQITQLFNLIPSDITRPLAHITHRLTYDRLPDDAAQVIEQLTTIEREVQRHDGRWYIVRFLPYRTLEEKIGGVVLSFVDITERKRAELVLLEAHHETERILETIAISEERLRLLNENVRDYAIIMLDPQGRVLDWNVGAERMFGYASAEILGQDLARIFTPEDIAQGAAEQEIGTAQSQGRSEDERWQVRKDGSRFWASGVLTAVYDEAGRLRGFWKIARDMTERMQAEAALVEREERLRSARDELEVRVRERTSELARANEALQQEVAEHARAEAARKDLLRQLVTAEEEERRRISRELHDQMGQQLTALLLGLQTLKDSSHNRRATVRAVAELQRMVDMIGQEVHQLALQLRPTALDDLGLAAALANYAADWAQQTQIEVDFHGGGLEHKRLAPHVETIVYRVVLETLTNVLKHARARHVSIILERRDEHAIAIVEDDGQGFDAEERLVVADQRLGLRGMRERVALVGGTLTIESTLGTGTTVFVRVPLNPIPEGAPNG